MLPKAERVFNGSPCELDSALMATDTAGTCDVREPCVYSDGMLRRCTYEFAHGGKHSWEHGAHYMGRVLRGYGVYAGDSGKLPPDHAEHLQEPTDDADET